MNSSPRGDTGAAVLNSRFGGARSGQFAPAQCGQVIRYMQPTPGHPELFILTGVIDPHLGFESVLMFFFGGILKTTPPDK